MATLFIWARRWADSVAVALLAAMFVTFILQIFFRYVLRQPLGWTIEACLLAWLWIVFWGAAFLLDDHEHVRFDILYNHVTPRVRGFFAAVSAIAIIVAMIRAFPATVDFVSFMKIESTSLLKFRFDYVFSIYLIFSAVIILRYLWRLVSIIRHRGMLPVDALTTKFNDDPST